jgi:hypothetical protein
MKSMTTTVALLLVSIPFANAEGSKVAPNLAGKYRCQPDPRECLMGQTFTVTQSGDRLEIENEKGEHSRAELTSHMTLTMGPPWNNLGTIYGGAIQWSNGTRWAKAD